MPYGHLGAIGEDDSLTGFLADRVRGQDGFGGEIAVRTERRRQLGDTGFDGRHGQRDADEAGRAHQDVLRRAPQALGGQLAHPAGVMTALLTSPALAFPELSITAAARPFPR